MSQAVEPETAETNAPEYLDYPVNSPSIASSLKIPEGSVRKYLSNLVKDGVLDRTTRGFYILKPMDGVRSRFSEIKLRVQNVEVYVLGFGVVESDLGVVLLEGNPGVCMDFGVKRDRIGCGITCDEGLDVAGLRLARGLLIRECERRGFDIPVDAWMVSGCEFLWDYVGIRMEGINCLTFTDFMGNLEKIYNKPWGVRHEVKLGRMREVGLEAVIGILGRGVEFSNINALLDSIAQKIDENTDAVKGNTRVELDFLLVFREWFNRTIDDSA